MLIPLLTAGLVAATTLSQPPAQPAANAPITIRVATFNVEDVRTADLMDPANTRLRQLAEVIQRVRPNVILINEIAYDMPGAPPTPNPTTPHIPPNTAKDATPGLNGQRFADNFLAVSQGPGLKPLHMHGFMAPTNTGMPSGFDLDNNGKTVNAFPPPTPPNPDGSPGQPSKQGRDYGGDCWGFGTFPGQYGMALLVDDRLTILDDQVRTFRLMPWRYMPGALLPPLPPLPPSPPSPGKDGNDCWYNDKEIALFRLSSKNHWDVPVKLPNGAVVHFLASHPTPPAFDGPEKRNARRNHDEIRFWADYIDNAMYIVDDTGHSGGLDERAPFIILGDLNADPDEGSSYKDPIGSLLFTTKRINTSLTPTSDVAIDDLAPDDTAMWGLRVDYVLPSTNLKPLSAGIWRLKPAGSARFPSDHFPVWMNVRVPPPAPRPGRTSTPPPSDP